MPQHRTARVNPIVWLTPWLLLAFLLSGCFGGGGGVTPVDPDNPTPVAKPLWFVMVEDSFSRTPNAITTDSNLEYWHAKESQGHRFAIVQSIDREGKPTAAAAKYVKYTSKAGIPCFILMRMSDSKILTYGKLPATTADVDKIIAKYGRR